MSNVSTDGPAGVDDDDSDGGHFDGDVGNELFGEFFVCQVLNSS
jgi:hypothetical protein